MTYRSADTVIRERIEALEAEIAATDATIAETNAGSRPPPLPSQGFAGASTATGRAGERPESFPAYVIAFA